MLRRRSLSPFSVLFIGKADKITPKSIGKTDKTAYICIGKTDRL